MDTERSCLYNRRVICWLRSWPQPSEHSGLEGGLLLMNSLRASAAQEKNSPSWLAWRSRGGTCCRGAWGCCCPRKQEGGAAADASLPGGKEDEEGLSLALFTVGVVAVVWASCPEGVLVLLSCLVPRRWQTQHYGRGHLKEHHLLLRMCDRGFLI